MRDDKFIVTENGVERLVNYRGDIGERELILPKETFIECYEKWILNNEWKKPQKSNCAKGKYPDVRKRIIDYLNLRCGTNYRADSAGSAELINGRLSEGYKEEDFYLVIDKKANEWMGTEHEKYLRPMTLFRPSNFESYVNQNIITKSDKINRIENRINNVDNW